jgi:branched-chain amino acid transport system substrate-binding protein
MNRLAAGAVCTYLRGIVLALLTSALAIYAVAETPGVTDNGILIGSCSALDGPAHFLGRQTVLGASAYLHMVNDEGGVFGRKIQLQAFDDSYDPDRAPACFKRMTREGVFAL